MTLAEVIARRWESQQAFAEKAEIDPGQLSKYLALERGDPEGVAPSASGIAAIQKHAGRRFDAAYWADLQEARAGSRRVHRAAARKLSS